MTGTDAAPRHKGRRRFVARKAEGVRLSRKPENPGDKGIVGAGLIFGDCRISADGLPGGEEGRGMQAAPGGLEPGRIDIVARGGGLAGAARMDRVRHARQRKTFGPPIAGHQAIRPKPGERARRLRAPRLRTHDAARADDGGQSRDMGAGMAKHSASEAAVENALEAR